MKITTAKNGNSTISDLSVCDLRLMANVIEDGAWQVDHGGQHSEMALRLARLLRAAAMHPTLTISCARSTTRPEDCFVDDDDLVGEARVERMRAAGRRVA